MRPKLLVVGSMAMDLITTTTKMPEAGETVVGTGFSTAPGGKGANQAVQAARLVADVTMVGMVGNDDFGRALIQSMKDSGVNTEHVLVTDKAPTGIANIQIEKNESGTENRILIVPGGNFAMTVEDVTFVRELVGEYDMVILQNEIPTDVNCVVAKWAKEKGVPVMLNPAPYRELPRELIACLTYISPNEHEAADIAGLTLGENEDIETAVKAVHALGTDNVLITLGGRGCAYSDGKTLQYANSVSVAEVQDPTAAGDSFIGAFCTAVASGVPIADALKFANCTAGITVTVMGAQTSLPHLDRVLDVMKQNGYDTVPFNGEK